MAIDKQYLVGGFNQVGVKIKNAWNHHLDKETVQIQ